MATTSTRPGLVRNIVIGAVIGAVIGLVVGAIVRLLVGSGSWAVYEVIFGPAGLVLGLILGAFYGGALALPREKT